MVNILLVSHSHKLAQGTAELVRQMATSPELKIRVAAGLGAYWVALFHLATHAFFKSVLFLGAGNVMHALNDEINIKNMGGLYKHMKGTAIIMIIASLALAGIFPLAGFFSKDLILEVAFGSQSFIIWTVLFVTAGLTAFYSFRLIMYVFLIIFYMKVIYPELIIYVI